MIQIPEFDRRDDLFAFLRENKRFMLDSKKSEVKHSDSVETHLFNYEEKTDNITKAEINPDVFKMDSFKVTSVINTTNLMDSHSDVHFPGIWQKSLQEQKILYLLQEHVMSFKNIISDKVKAYTKNMTWAELGYKYDGITQALLFVSDIEKERNEYMAEQYMKDRVKNHSVGMRYVKILFAINSESKWDAEEKAVWDKYYPQIANKEVADSRGYFWAVLEAKVIEGSAVPLGSNYATPTISVGKAALSTLNNEPPLQGTQVNFLEQIKTIKFL